VGRIKQEFIIAVTADVMKAPLRVAEIGMNHYLLPINRETLFQAIKAWSNYSASAQKHV
jgi:hypothetical protein